jgi:transaldolase
MEIANWGDNVYVKIPITNTKGLSTSSVIQFLVERKVKVNVTALMTCEQVRGVAKVLSPTTPSFVSIFAGRIADTGRDPIPVVRESLEILSEIPLARAIWASPRELLNVFQANDIGCHVITATSDILNKLNTIGKDLNAYSLETVQMFYNDAKHSNFEL